MANLRPQTPLHQLYDEDFVCWVEATVDCLKRRDIEQLDWNGLIEEIEDWGKSARRELESRLSVLLVHLLKRCYVNLPGDYRGWQLTIVEQRNALKRLLIPNPAWLPPIQQGKQPFAPTVWPFGNRGYVTRIWYKAISQPQNLPSGGAE